MKGFSHKDNIRDLTGKKMSCVTEHCYVPTLARVHDVKVMFKIDIIRFSNSYLFNFKNELLFLSMLEREQ